MSSKLILIFIVLTLTSAKSYSQGFQINDLIIGDSNVNYVNPEISPKYNYMLWMEVDTANGTFGMLWHCGINPASGKLIPENGKGFGAFISNIYGRPADWGEDSIGVYYVGLNSIGQLVLVRPTGHSSGISSVIPVTLDLRRRAIYPSQLPGVNKRYISFILNENQIGGPTNPANNIFHLKLIDLDFPQNEQLIETQERVFPSFVGFDVVVPRWIKGISKLTYGFKDSFGKVQVKLLTVHYPISSSVPVTFDTNSKVDAHPLLLNQEQFLVAGLNSTDSAGIYKKDVLSSNFILSQYIVPNSINLNNPVLNQSHEPFVWNGKAYSTYQVNEYSNNFINITFSTPGEIYISTVDHSVNYNWLINKYDTLINIYEPEPYTGSGKVFVYYSSSKADTTIPVLKKITNLHLCETPLSSGTFVINHENNRSDHSILLSPNPTNGMISIVSLIKSLKDFRVTIYNSLGREIESFKILFETNQHNVNLKSYASGVYFMSFLSPDNLKTLKRFIILK